MVVTPDTQHVPSVYYGQMLEIDAAVATSDAAAIAVQRGPSEVDSASKKRLENQLGRLTEAVRRQRHAQQQRFDQERRAHESTQRLLKQLLEALASGGFIPSRGHSSRICKILRSEQYRQVRLYRQVMTTSLRCTSDAVGSNSRIRAFSRFVDQTTEWLWQLQLKQLRSRLAGKKPMQKSPAHGAAQLDLPGFVQDALSLGPMFAVEKKRPQEEL
ncbi:hypothetical protein HPB52_013208 [Rhipicephalus sanguineus]|uniref:Uncharacterized protein n=1 Tax=Rhipicephalus sanguineus TaxID=34632 RepID=A0A9D4PXB6_RHISA|nr:hypothetical protein HPB52_013208 [Rhipicephalus sanguineus]